MRWRNSLELIFYKAYSDVKAEAARSYLGLLWWILEPVLYLGAFYVLFVLVLQRGGPDFVPTFLCGAVVWKWFDSAIRGGANSIKAYQGLLQQVYVQKFVFPVIVVLGSTARFLPVYALLALFLWWYGVPVRVSWLAIPLIMLVEFLLAVAGAMLLSAITPFLPDLKVAIDNGMTLLFFLSGVFFNINEVHEPLRHYLLLNPMAGLINEYRSVMLHGNWPDWGRLATVALISLILGMLAFMLLWKMDRKYGKLRF